MFNLTKAIKVIGLKQIIPYITFRLYRYYFKGSSTFSYFSTLNYISEHDKNFFYLSCKIAYSNLKVKLRRSGSDTEAFNQVLVKKEYNDVIALIDFLPKERKKVIIDAGANIGLFSIFVNAHIARASFICIEPNSMNFALLVENITYNNINVVRNYNKALWTVTDKIILSNNFRDKQSWSYSVINSESSSGDLIDTITMNEIMLENGIEDIDILKIDIEGAEKYLFDDINSQRIIFRCVSILIVEVHEEVFSKFDLVQLFWKYDYFYFNSNETYFAIKRNLISKP